MSYCEDIFERSLCAVLSRDVKLIYKGLIVTCEVLSETTSEKNVILKIGGRLRYLTHGQFIKSVIQ